MGRNKAAIPRGGFYLKAVPNGQGQLPIYLRYYVQGKYVQRSCDIWIYKTEWDDAKQEVKKNKSFNQINSKLRVIKKKVDDQILAFKNGALTADVVQRMMDNTYVPENEKAKTIGFIAYCNQCNESMYPSKYGYTTFYNKGLYIKQFEKYLLKKVQKEPLSLCDISLEIISNYANHLLKDKSYKNRESVNKTLVPLVQSVQSAQINGLLPASIAAPIIQKAYISTKETVYNPDKEGEKKIRYLTPEQLEAFKNYVPKYGRTEKTKDIMQIFLFSYYAFGLRISDIVTLEWGNIDLETGTLDKIQVKTKQKAKIKPQLCVEAIQILKEWESRNLNDRFVFNYLPENFVFGIDTADFLNKRIKAVTRTFNQSLKAIGDNLEYPFNLSIHVARHTFCVHAISISKVNLSLVSQLMGHSSILATEKTYAEFLDSSVDEGLEQLTGIYTYEKKQ